MSAIPMRTGVSCAPKVTVATSNKQLNFVQHVMTLLKKGGRAAMVLPDNCLFADQAGEVFEILTQDCRTPHRAATPPGTFTPYSQGVKANVVFFTKGYPTENVWIYDSRTNVPSITKKDRPLTPKHFTEFERCYGNIRTAGPSARRQTRRRIAGGRSISAKSKSVISSSTASWLREESLGDSDELSEPEELVTDAIEELEATIGELSVVLRLLDDGAGTAGR